jgi:hypothetical protein
LIIAQGIVRKELVPAAGAMSPGKYSFVPDGEHSEDQETFALKVGVAVANFVVFSEILRQVPPPGVSFAAILSKAIRDFRCDWRS